MGVIMRVCRRREYGVIMSEEYGSYYEGVS